MGSADSAYFLKIFILFNKKSKSLFLLKNFLLTQLEMKINLIKKNLTLKQKISGSATACDHIV